MTIDIDPHALALFFVVAFLGPAVGSWYLDKP